MFDSLRFKGYKSFPNDVFCEISSIKYLNLFIGKNNSGKSSALDVIGAACSPIHYKNLITKPKNFNVGYIINEDTLKSAFPSVSYRVNTSFSAGKNYIGKKCWYDLKLKTVSYDGEYFFEYGFDKELNQEVVNREIDWLTYKKYVKENKLMFKKLSAERNILPEIENYKLILDDDGVGATNLIRKIVNNKKYDENLIEVELLNALNKIMGVDASFENIRIQETDGENQENQWEVYLQEKNSNRFPLSQTGSGLKTIILVLLNLLILPRISQSSDFVFGFEELENNLHPALQRRLFEFIYNYATENKVYIFITTHSHVAINMFFDKEEATIYHVVKDGQVSKIKKIDNYLDKVEILNDLDVKASDLLQANGIVWVEGPSDRIYIKKWLEIFGGGKIKEGKDYQFVYYGGRLLSHYTTEETTELLNVLLVNRNSAIVMDSDKTSKQKQINTTKKRIQEEFRNKNLFSWITQGKEIENYISFEAIEAALGVTLKKQCEQYELFPRYIEPYYNGFANDKVHFANRVKDYIQFDEVLDLKTKIRDLYETILSWN